nr:zinc finger, CCHC-type [Tanacetum cinerariifolium]
RSQEYHEVCTRPDIASADVGMLDGFGRGLQTDVQVFVDFDYAMGRLITVMGRSIISVYDTYRGCKGGYLAKGTSNRVNIRAKDSGGYYYTCLVKGGPRIEVPAQDEVVVYRYKLKPMTYLKEVEETLGTPIEVEPLDDTKLEDLGLNTYNYDLPLSSREVPSFNEPEPQPQPLPNFPPLDVGLVNEIGLKPPIKPPSLDSFKMKGVDHLIIYTPPSPHMASFCPKDISCYYHLCVDDPK